MAEEEGVKEGAKARDLLSEGGMEGRGLSLTNREQGRTLNEAAEVHGGVEGGPFPEGQDGGEGGREDGGALWWLLGLCDGGSRGGE